MKINSLVSVIGIAVLSACSHQQVSDHDESLTTLYRLYNFEQPVLPQALKSENTNLTLVPGPNGQQLQVSFQSKQHHEASLIFTPEQPWQWGQYPAFGFAMDIENPADESIHFYAKTKDGDGKQHNRSFAVPANSRNTYYMELRGADLTTDTGLRANPKAWITGAEPMIWRHSDKVIDVDNVTSISFTVRGLLQDKSVNIDNVRLVAPKSLDADYLTGLLDEFGQNDKVDTPYKVESTEQMRRQATAEAKQLSQGAPTDRSRFGGWREGPKLEATGRFRTAKYKGKWSLVDPNGYLFYSNGIANVRMSNTSTLTGYDFDHTLLDERSSNDLTPEDSKGLNRVSDKALPTRHVVSPVRADMFTWLPEYDEPLGAHYGYRRSVHSGPVERGETYSFYRANLERKYKTDDAPDYMATWRDVTVDRMLQWGFTSFGNWIDPAFYQMDRIPYFANGWIIGDFKTVSSGNDYWSPLPDPFDPLFAERAEATIKRVAQEVDNNPWCVGVFIDNEKSWGAMGSVESQYGIVLNTLTRRDADSPTKAAFSRWLMQRYDSVAALNQAWGTDFANWQSVSEGVSTEGYTEAQLADFAELLQLYAEKYFEVVHDTLEQHMPDYLYMGARFADWGMTPEIRRAAAKYADVVSYNYYKEGINEPFFGFLAELDKPSIIGEFHNGATDSGVFNPGLIHSESQADRGEMYVDYVTSAVENPYLVGTHWFQYLDSPITGRAYDGENYNVGFVSVADVPYSPLVKAAQRINKTLYHRRFQ
ncbi:beta-galactosidase [Gilvimarinus agarilyticus]|uniref:beta-galactosidase n=1 Tax=Gilvimarinus sp. 2_MG-2023 TaxID=3062666 RepID=UPI001C089B7F|nr:beta-galactosidase [Gilvimarinus sp. 2_MG-2023]MBU2886397.1 beta-galactosidase [Gilvimarinus agarilyticus]MDO6571076.1 beta-galactosidase [Gilvimarinus sp. 2_MG-2023]